MENIYVRLGWPEYQVYQQSDDFNEHAHYCPDDDVYFVERDWYNEQDVSGVQDASTTIDYNGTTIELSSRYVGKDLPPWSAKNNSSPIHHHKVTIRVGNKKHTFDFWSGPAHYKTTTVMTEGAMIDAFNNFLMDCTLGDQSIDDFQSELGYKNVSECIRAYNACQKELEAWKKFFIDPYELENWLRENYDL